MNVELIITNAFLSDLLSNHWPELSTDILKHIAINVDYKTVPDGVIADNKEIRDIIRWDRLEKMKLIRILIRCIDKDVEDLDNIKNNLHKYEYKISDLSYLFMRKPEFIDFFPIDLKKLNTSEASFLLSFGSNFFLDKIDISKYTFNFRESMNIIRAYNYDRGILEKVNYKSLKGYQISEIIINTGQRDLDILDITLMNNIDWINLLEVNPEMIKYCNYNKFMSGDIFYSIKLYCMFDDIDLSYLVINRNTEEISPLGWEILLIKKPDKFLNICNFDKLEEVNWIKILKFNPEFSKYRKTTS